MAVAIQHVMLESHLYELVEAGYRGKALQAELEAINAQLDPPADQEFLLTLVARYPESEAESEPEADPIRTAIESGDAKHIFKVVPLLAQLTPLEWGLVKQEIKETFGKRINLNDLLAAIKDEQRRRKLQENGEKKDIADIVRDWAMQYRDTWAYDANMDVWRTWNGAYWQEQVSRHLLDDYAIAALQEADIPVNGQNGINLFERVAEAKCIRDFTPVPGLINFDNGTLDVATGLLRGYSKDDHLTYCLPYGYNPYGAHPNIDRFLEEVLPDEHARLALMAHGGLALMGDTLMYNFYVLLGTPQCGKSTILALLNALCGTHNPHAFAGHSIFSREVEGKRARYKWGKGLITCVDELPQEALREEEILKAMSAHSGVEMRGIGRDEHTDNRWKPKLVMATNDQPRYSDHSGAVKERSIFAEIRQARPKEERRRRLLQDELLPELGAFAASCLDLAKQVLERGYYPLSVAMKQLIDRIANEGNPLKGFVVEKCIVDGLDETRITSSSIHAQYKAFCDEKGHTRVMASNTLSMTLRTMYMNVTVPPYPFRIDGMLQRGLKGIRMRTNEDPESLPTYQDDQPLDRPARVTVYGVYGPQKATVDGEEQPVEPSRDGMSTVSTVFNSNSPYRETPTPCAEASQGGCLPLESNNGKRPYTPYTQTVDAPVERHKAVYGSFSPIVDTVDANKEALLAIGETLGFPRLEYRPGHGLLAGRGAWEKTVARIDDSEASVSRLTEILAFATSLLDAQA